MKLVLSSKERKNGHEHYVFECRKCGSVIIATDMDVDWEGVYEYDCDRLFTAVCPECKTLNALFTCGDELLFLGRKC